MLLRNLHGIRYEATPRVHKHIREQTGGVIVESDAEWDRCYEVGVFVVTI